jgi:hypothetical protein
MQKHLLILLALFVYSIQGQENVQSVDVPYLWGHAWESGAKPHALGGAFTAIANGQTAMRYNPAGLGQMRYSEVFATFSQLNYRSEVTSLGSVSSQKTGYTQMSDLGFTLPIPTYRGSLVIGFSYHQVQDLDGALNLGRFNPRFSAYDSVTVHYDNYTDGAVSQTSIGGAIEVSQDLFLGLSLNIWGGNREYNSRFSLYDTPYNLYYWSRFDSTDHTQTDFSGLNFTLGFLYQWNNIGSLAAVLKTPVSLKAREHWNYLDNPFFEPDAPDDIIESFPPFYAEGSGISEYKIRSPWILRLGGALNKGPITLSCDIEFLDYSQIRYLTDTAYEDMDETSANILIRKELQNIQNIYLGGEFKWPGVPLFIRGGYTILKNPVRTASPKTLNRWSAGLGFGLSDQISIDMGYSRARWNGFTDNLISDEQIEAGKLLISLNYKLSSR